MSTPLTFCDGVLGSPAKDNVEVVGGLSIGAAEGLQLTNGTFTCRPGALPPEDCDNNIDDDQDGATDCDDSQCVNDAACREICNDNIDNDYPFDLCRLCRFRVHGLWQADRFAVNNAAADDLR